MGYSPFRHIGSALWKQNPIHLTFFVTRRCNAKCPFCFYLSTGPVESAIELNIGEIEKISSSMDRLLWLAFSGGETFLRDDIVEITRIFYERNKPAIILFPTNGLLTDIIRKKIEAVLKYCGKSTIVVKLSLDGLEDLNNSLRGVKDSFQKTLQTYNALAGLIEDYPNFELGINTVFCSANQGCMDEIIEFVNKLDKVRTHTISMIRGDVPDERLKDVSTKKYHETIKKMESNLKNKSASIYRFRGARLKSAQDILQRRLIHETLIQKRRLIPCYAGRLSLVLTESGDVYPCESFSPQRISDTMRLGNVRNNGYDLKGILKSEGAKKVIQSIQDNGCYCTHECYFMTNILFNLRMYPALLKEYIQLKLRPLA